MKINAHHEFNHTEKPDKTDNKTFCLLLCRFVVNKHKERDDSVMVPCAVPLKAPGQSLTLFNTLLVINMKSCGFFGVTGVLTEVY